MRMFNYSPVSSTALNPFWQLKNETDSGSFVAARPHMAWSRLESTNDNLVAGRVILFETGKKRFR